MVNVLIAVDSSEQAESAFKWYLKTLHRPEFNVILLNCLEMFFNGDYSRNTLDTMRQEIEAESDVLKTKLMGIASQAGMIIAALTHNDFTTSILFLEFCDAAVNCQWMTQLTTKPGPSIVDIASQQKVEFIVTGTRGMGVLKRVVFGSVSGHVVQHAHCPVLVYKAEES